MKTKLLITQTATNLFNEKGTGAVSTNHIAEACGISPGNLYYHYASKGEIIRAVFEELFTLWDQQFGVSAEPPGVEDLRSLLHKNFEIMWSYRFVYRELPALLRRDELLQTRYSEVRARGFEGFQQLFSYFVVAGVLRSGESLQTISDLADLCWLISEFWLASVEVSGKSIDANSMAHGERLMLQVLHPYLIENDISND